MLTHIHVILQVIVMLGWSVVWWVSKLVCPNRGKTDKLLTTKTIRFGLAVFFVDKEGNGPLKAIKY